MIAEARTPPPKDELVRVYKLAITAGYLDAVDWIRHAVDRYHVEFPQARRPSVKEPDGED